MTNVPQVGHEKLDAAVDDALSHVLSTGLGDQPHLAKAVIYERIAAVANHRSKSEVAAAREEDSVSWDEIAHAFGLSVPNARELFRTAPTGMPG